MSKPISPTIIEENSDELLALPSVADFYNERRNITANNYMQGLNIFPLGSYPERDKKVQAVWQGKN